MKVPVRAYKKFGYCIKAFKTLQNLLLLSMGTA